MLLGWGSGGTYGLDQATATASRFWAFYAQDDWQVTRNLTLNLGMRYDFDVPRRERFHRLNWFDFEVSSPLRGKVAEFPDLKGVMRFVDDETPSPFDGDWNNVQPRFGFAYALGKRRRCARVTEFSTRFPPHHRASRDPRSVAGPACSSAATAATRSSPRWKTPTPWDYAAMGTRPAGFYRPEPQRLRPGET